MGNEKLEQITRIIELSCMRHGVNELDLEGTLTDAEDIMSLLTPAPAINVGALDDLEEVRKAVFGDVGDEPDVYSDYDRCSELSGKMRRALSALTQSPPPSTDVTPPEPVGYCVWISPTKLAACTKRTVNAFPVYTSYNKEGQDRLGALNSAVSGIANPLHSEIERLIAHAMGKGLKSVPLDALRIALTAPAPQVRAVGS